MPPRATWKGHMKLSLVSFADRAQLHWSLELAWRVRQRAQSARLELQANGGTNVSAGLDEALRQLEQTDAARVRRIVLISDGLFEDRDEDLVRRARDAVRLEAVLSAVGVGLHSNVDLLPSLADAGEGNFFYLADVGESTRILERELMDRRIP